MGPRRAGEPGRAAKGQRRHTCGKARTDTADDVDTRTTTARGPRHKGAKGEAATQTHRKGTDRKIFRPVTTLN